MSPEGDASKNQWTGGIRRGSSSGGTLPARPPRANAAAWNTGAYSSMESGCRLYTITAPQAQRNVVAATNACGRCDNRVTSCSRAPILFRAITAAPTTTALSTAADGSLRMKRYSKISGRPWNGPINSRRIHARPAMPSEPITTPAAGCRSHCTHPAILELAVVELPAGAATSIARSGKTAGC